MEIAILIFLVIIAVELGLIIYDLPQKREEKEDARTTRRDVYGTFQNPLADSYRKNTRNQYIPVHPGGKMLEGLGDDEE